MTYDVQISRPFIFVTTQRRHPRLDELATKRRGKWQRQHSCYSFPIDAEEQVRQVISEIDVPQTLPREPETPAAPVAVADKDPQPDALAPGWSRAARARQGRSHPLGEVVEVGNGFTVYEDTEVGGGRVRIYDKS